MSAQPEGEWRSAAGRAVGWIAAGMTVAPVLTRVAGLLGARWIAAGDDGGADRASSAESLTRALLLPGVLGPVLLVYGGVRLARAMRAAPGADSPVFAFGPVLFTMWLLARVAAVPLVLLTEGSGPLLAGVYVLGLFPPVVALLLAAAAAARAGVAFVVWAAWGVALVSVGAALAGGEALGLVADAMVAGVLVVAASVLAGSRGEGHTGR